jgi:hypothetical protein
MLKNHPLRARLKKWALSHQKVSVSSGYLGRTQLGKGSGWWKEGRKYAFIYSALTSAIITRKSASEKYFQSLHVR